MSSELEQAQDSQVPASAWAVEYLRPDGWHEAGRGFVSEVEAKAAAFAQLPGHVHFRVVHEFDGRK